MCEIPKLIIHVIVADERICQAAQLNEGAMWHVRTNPSCFAAGYQRLCRELESNLALARDGETLYIIGFHGPAGNSEQIWKSIGRFGDALKTCLHFNVSAWRPTTGQPLLIPAALMQGH